MSKLKGFGFADYEIINRFKEETAYDKIDKIIDWSRIDKVLRSKYKKNKNAVGNRLHNNRYSRFRYVGREKK